MATRAQVNANRSNSQKSTGPATPAGKAKSSLNRLSHGFASNARFIQGEDPKEFDALLADLTGEYRPATPTEQLFVERMAHNHWVGLRAMRLQGDAIGGTTVLSDVRANLSLLIRYQTTADRGFHKSHTELVKAQKERQKSAIGFESQKADEAAAVPPEPPAETAPEPEKPSYVVVEPFVYAATDPRWASLDEEIEWLMNADMDEIRASGL